MIVTGQHSFPFSAISGEESGGLLPDSSDSLSFADLLGKAELEYEFALKRDESRNIEIFNESVLNENNDYQVVVGENGNPVTEMKGMTEDFSQTVTDAGAPDTGSAHESDSAHFAKNTDDIDGTTDKSAEMTARSGAVAENHEQQSEKVIAQGHSSNSTVKDSPSKQDSVKNASQKQKSFLSEKTFAVIEKDCNDKDIKTASAAVEANGKKVLRAEQRVSMDGKEAGEGKVLLRHNGEDPAVARPERVITVSVLRAESEKSENRPSTIGAKKINTNSAGSEEKAVSAEKSTVSDTISSLFSTSIKESGGIEKVMAQNISKADLVKELKEQGSIEILREAKILVRDGQSGEIKLVLRPQELGTVKINLILENKHIVGKIFVDNNIVKEALQTAFGDLKEVFAEQGMELGALDVFVSQESQHENLFSGDGEIDVTPLKMAHAVGAVEKHAGIIVTRFDRSAIDIEV